MNKNYNLILTSILLLILFSNCQNGDVLNTTQNNGTGQGGSLSRFAIVGDYLYTIDGHYCKIFDISTPLAPQIKMTESIWTNAETIFSHGNNLFLGTPSGFFIYGLDSPLYPTELSFNSHLYSCDPIVADDDYAYSTLRSATTRCSRGVNELDIYDISDLRNPKLVFNYPMTSPLGLCINNKTLFVCEKGLKIYDVKDASRPILTSTQSFNSTDILSMGNNNYLMSTDDGIYQFKHTVVSKKDSIEILSKIPIIKGQ